MSVTAKLVLALLAEHGPCPPDDLAAQVDRLPGRAGDVLGETDGLIARGLVRCGPGGLDPTPSGRAAAAAWLYGDGASEQPDDERVLRFALLFAEAVRTTRPA